MLSTLEPKRRARVMDLLAEVGHDITDWANYSNGANNPAANPRLCYEWAFLQEDKDIVLNLWYEDLREEAGSIVLKENIRRDISLYAGLANRSVWRNRAEKVDRALRKAYEEGVPVRVILCSGKRRDRNEPSSEASRVKRRDLDPVPWAVTSYDDKTGDAVIVRGAKPVDVVDQFSVDAVEDSPTERRSLSGSAFVRDGAVRFAALVRAEGRCEFCGQPGFITGTGKVFLETHHIVPLGEGGADSIRNVAALCPNHHREAHHGAAKEKIRAALLRKVCGRNKLTIG